VEALVWLRQAGFARVLVTNPLSIGRDFFTEDRLQEIHAELEGRLAARGARRHLILAAAGRFLVAPDLVSAVDLILNGENQGQ
jgi:histidinol phosphatase-like enzyme